MILLGLIPIIRKIKMYLIDTNVISELRKGSRANQGVIEFFNQTKQQQQQIYLSSITIGELRRGIELLRHRQDNVQATQLEYWLNHVIEQFQSYILTFDPVASQIWGRLRVPHAENAIDKQIAAVALQHQLIMVTRNIKDFAHCGLALLNPFN